MNNPIEMLFNVCETCFERNDTPHRIEWRVVVNFFSCSLKLEGKIIETIFCSNFQQLFASLL